MLREKIENVIKNLYKARIQNDVEACLDLCSENVALQLAGSKEASAIASEVSGTSALRDFLIPLMADWQWNQYDFKAILIDGNQAAVKYELNVTHIPSNRTITTQIMDHMVFNSDHKVTCFVQFLDTALIQQLIVDGQENT